MTKVFLTPDAERELARLSAALDFRSSGLGEKFADAFLTAAEAIAENPRLNPEIPTTWRDELVRAKRIPGFPSFLILYHEVVEGVDIVHVMSAGRNWRRTNGGHHD